MQNVTTLIYIEEETGKFINAEQTSPDRSGHPLGKEITVKWFDESQLEVSGTLHSVTDRSDTMIYRLSNVEEWAYHTSFAPSYTPGSEREYRDFCQLHGVDLFAQRAHSHDGKYLVVHRNAEHDRDRSADSYDVFERRSRG